MEVVLFYQRVNWNLIKYLILIIIFPFNVLALDLNNVDLDLIYKHNEIRLKHSKDIFDVNPLLTYAARKHALWMAQKNKLSHLEGKQKVSDRVESVGYNWTNIGENIAVGQNTPTEVMNDWMHSIGHKDNILGNFDEIGISSVNLNGTIYWCVVFGVSND